MQPHTRSLGRRMGLSAVLVIASVALGGCVFLGASPSPVETDTGEGPAAADGYYEDTEAGYAVLFPGEPTVDQLKINGTDRFADLAAYADEGTGMYFLTRGEVRDGEFDLRQELLGWLSSVTADGQIDAGSADDLEGLPAAKADLTIDGKDTTTIVAGEGTVFYQLIAAGGTEADRQAFFDTFELLD